MTSLTQCGSRSRLFRWISLVVGLAVVGSYGGWKVFTMMRTARRAGELMEAMRRDSRLLLPEGMKTAHLFLKDLQDRNLDAAYEATTSAFRERMSREEFSRFVVDHPALSKPVARMETTEHYGEMHVNSWSDTIEHIPASLECRASAQLSPGKSATVRLVLTLDGTQAKVEQCTSDAP